MRRLRELAGRNFDDAEAVISAIREVLGVKVTERDLATDRVFRQAGARPGYQQFGRKVPGSDRTLREFLEMAGRALAETSMGVADQYRAPEGLVVEVTNQFHINTNIGAQFTDGLDRNRQLNPDVLDWGMQ